MFAVNHTRMYRPVRGGIAIENPRASVPGTLGLLGRDEEGKPWLVSCYHILCRPNRADFDDQEPIHQPIDEGPETLIAHVYRDRADPDLDCAAAKLVDQMGAMEEILGLGPVGTPTVPTVGLRVIKSGIATGITEGVVKSVSDQRVTIAVTDGFPENYKLCKFGDSGAVWMTRDGVAPVALHNGGNDTGQHYATAAPILSVLESLRLRLP